MRDAYRDEIFQQYTENIQSLIRIQRNQAIDVWTIKYVLLDAPLLVDEGSADHMGLDCFNIEKILKFIFTTN